MFLAMVLVAGACSSTEVRSVEAPARGEIRDFGPVPVFGDAELSAEVDDAISVLFDDGFGEATLSEEADAIATFGASGDVRLGWVLSDMLRLARDEPQPELLAKASSDLLGTDFEAPGAWRDLTDHLMAWDIPAPPGYLDIKRSILTSVVPDWEPFFDESSDVDWRLISWGGVLIDDRPFGTTDDSCRCIPAADNPTVSSADDALWLGDDDVIFGVEINGESRAYPRRIMEVREMVNDSLGGRDFAMPYCTLCGSAQVWFTDDLPAGVDRPVLRTSGLLTRSNKVMFDLNTFSVFDTFLGTAVTGPLAQDGITLRQHSVVTSTWGQWRADHPNTTVLVEELALRRDFDFRNGRDADGPIFPIGAVDPRLPVHEDVLGVISSDGKPVAFHVDSALAALERGDDITIDGIMIVADGSGLRAVDATGGDLGGHEAFWFAWSQFYPDTVIWPAG